MVEFTQEDFLACLKVTQGYRTDEVKRNAFASFVTCEFWELICECGAGGDFDNIWQAFGCPGYFHRLKHEHGSEFDDEYWHAMVHRRNPVECRDSARIVVAYVAEPVELAIDQIREKNYTLPLSETSRYCLTKCH